MHFFYKLYQLSCHPHQWYADCQIPLLYSFYSRKWWAGKGGKLVWYYGLGGGPLIWGIKALIRGCMGPLFEEYAICLFLCGKHCPILFLLSLSAYFSSLKNVWKTKKTVWCPSFASFVWIQNKQKKPKKFFVSQNQQSGIFKFNKKNNGISFVIDLYWYCQ